MSHLKRRTNWRSSLSGLVECKVSSQCNEKRPHGPKEVTEMQRHRWCGRRKLKRWLISLINQSSPSQIHLTARSRYQRSEICIRCMLLFVHIWAIRWCWRWWCDWTNAGSKTGIAKYSLWRRYREEGPRYCSRYSDRPLLPRLKWKSACSVHLCTRYVV